MKRGSKIITITTLAIAVLFGGSMGYSNYSRSQVNLDSCQRNLAAWRDAKAKADATPSPAPQAVPDDGSDPFAELRNEFSRPQTFESAHGPEPLCTPPDSNWVHVKLGAWVGAVVFAVLFVLTHIGWLLARAFNRAMEKLSS